MTDFLALSLVTIFGLVGLWHVYWAFGGTLAKAGAIPEINGRPVFSPSRIGTMIVALALFGSAMLVAVVAKFTMAFLPRGPAVGLSYVLALILFIRAIGDFRLVGFFKRIRGTRFSKRDTLFYSPLCLALSAGVFIVAFFSTV